MIKKVEQTKEKRGNLLKIIIIGFIILTIIMGVIWFFLFNNSFYVSEYTLGKDTIKSITEVVGDVKVSSTLTENKFGMLTKKIECKSSNPQEEILKYTDYLINQEGFVLTSPMDMLNYSSIKLSKESEDIGKILNISIHYGNSDYTIIIQKK